MIKVNEYFDAQVKSLGFENKSGKATVGVMEAGNYEFGTGSPERMTLISGAWELKLPGETIFRKFAKGEGAVIAGNSKFELRILEQSAYHCEFLPEQGN